MSDNAMTVVPQTGEVVRQGFGETEMETRADTAGSAMAAQAKASVEAAYIMALRRPRDIDQVRVKLMKACQRPRFAEAARYLRPVGGEKNKRTGEWEQKIAEGLSIRFAEEAARNMGNLDIDSYCLYDDPRKKIVRFVVTDLETNTKWSKTRTIEKTTERKALARNQQAIAQRVNSYGDVVFIVEATAEEVTKREGAEGSKAWRDGILKNLPADIKEECIETIRATVNNRAATDPDGERKRIMDSFAAIGIDPQHLKEYLGHDLATVSPAELVTLRGVYTSIKEGDMTWGDVLDAKAEVDEANERGKKSGPPTTSAGPTPAPANSPAPAAAASQAAPQAPGPKGQRNLTDVAAGSRAKREGSGKKLDIQTPGSPEARMSPEDASRVAASMPPPDPLPAWAERGPPREPGADDE